MYGLDYLGGAMYQSVLLKAHPFGWAAGFFADTFGKCWTVVDKLCQTDTCPLIRIHGPWTNHRYNPKLHDKAIFAAYDKTYELQAKYSNIEFQFSPVCESDARGVQWQKLFATLLTRHPFVKLICSINKGEPIKGVVTEIHGDILAPLLDYQYSFDGMNTVDSNVEEMKKKHKHARVLFFWHPSFNLKYKTKLSGDETKKVRDNDTAQPTDRVCKPTGELITSLVALASSKGDAKLKPRNTWKSHSDRHETPAETRAYKPVLITPAKVNEVVLVDAAGVIIAKSNKREPYADGRYRYYFGKYGYQIANKVLTAVAGNTSLGTINPAFREGEFR